jgi:hypothetical protein
MGTVRYEVEEIRRIHADLLDMRDFKIENIICSPKSSSSRKVSPPFPRH